MGSACVDGSQTGTVTEAVDPTAASVSFKCLTTMTVSYSGEDFAAVLSGGSIGPAMCAAIPTLSCSDSTSFASTDTIAVTFFCPLGNNCVTQQVVAGFNISGVNFGGSNLCTDWSQVRTVGGFAFQTCSVNVPHKARHPKSQWRKPFERTLGRRHTYVPTMAPVAAAEDTVSGLIPISAEA